MRRLLPLASVLLLTAACADSDGDGLSNGKEKKLGTNPDLIDSDGDGAEDGREVELGLDPTDYDTDGDGYADGAELMAGTDPADDDSVIYEGGWPYNAFKDDIDDPGISGRLAIGDISGNFEGEDQFGEDVQLYDFAGQGKMVMLDISAEWCGPCRQMASWMDGGNMQGMSQYEPIREAVDNGDIYWVTIIAQDAQGRPADGETAERWYDDFPHPNVPVIADPQDEMTYYMGLNFFPSVFLLDENMEYIQGPSSQSWVPALNEALIRLE